MGRIIRTLGGFSEIELLDLVRILKRGGMVCMATDTVYGLMCAADSREAVGRLAKLKGGAERPFLVLIGEISWLRALVADVPAVAGRLMARYWPGSLTIVFNADKGVGAWLKGPRDTIAVRYPNHLLSEQLLRAFGGPIVSSSANLHGEDACVTGSEACQALLEDVDCVVDSGRAPAALPSTIVDVTSGRPKVLRQGALKIEHYCISDDEPDRRV